MVQKALIVGINKYPSSPLQGCVNDAMDMEAMLKQHFGFSDIQMLLDGQATTANMKSGLTWLVTGAQPGDVLFFHYSGHGSQIRDTSDPDVEVDGLDEIICPVDLDWNTKLITDDYMKWVFDQVPAGVNLTVFLDCCNSGTALDQAESYQPLGVGEARDVAVQKGSRYLPPPAHLMPLLENRAPKPRMVQSRHVDNTGMLITGCQSHQTSADAYIGGRYNGAATYSLVSSCKVADYNINYKTLIEKMNDFMARSGYSQRPELDGSSALYGDLFLKGILLEGATPYVVASPPPPPPTTQNNTTALAQDESSKQNKVLFIIAGVIAVGIAFLALS
ncbi:caspase family protein [Candidatus Thorarchaeota archaeon]|nr:MAG: caspase family protein [Candidatus Thorarchaeota archaeon]